MVERIYTLRPIRPNKGIEMAYRKKLMKLIDEMQNSVKYWIEAGIQTPRACYYGR